MGNPEVKDLFYKTRFVGGWNLVAVFLYAPIGLILALLRVFISLQAYLLALLLLIPELSYIRKFVLRLMSAVLGIFVVEENFSEREKSVRVMVANNVSVLDHVPIHLLTGCFSPSKWDVWPLCLKVFEDSQDKHRFATSLRSHLHKSAAPLLLQPEDTTTNGKVGLLKFSTLSASVAPIVQPVCIQVWRPLGITTSTVDATFSTDLFWFLFCPITLYKIRYLPVIKRREGEADEDMAERIAQAIAKALGVVNTKFTVKDKLDYQKRYVMEINRRSTTHSTLQPSRISFEMQRMASQVAEVLPYVPYDAIVRDLSRTKNVDLTISNILEGSVRFTPLYQEQHASTSRTAVSSPTSSEASGSFSRFAQDRMLSFVERKTRLIEEARQRYMKKHGLTDKQ